MAYVIISISIPSILNLYIFHDLIDITLPDTDRTETNVISNLSIAWQRNSVGYEKSQTKAVVEPVSEFKDSQLYQYFLNWMIKV